MRKFVLLLTAGVAIFIFGMGFGSTPAPEVFVTNDNVASARDAADLAPVAPTSRPSASVIIGGGLQRSIRAESTAKDVADPAFDDVSDAPTSRPSASVIVAEVARPSQLGGGLHRSVRADSKVFERQAHRCTDKITVHKYQHLYSRTLFPVRHLQSSARLLEMGLGCDMPRCVAGGARLFRAYLPHVAYHVLEFNPNLCRSRFNTSSVDTALATYIEDHLCAGSSADPSVLQACGTRFGPFDVIVDDASHLQQHVMAGFQYWFKSPFLKPGGVYIVEDLQVIFRPNFERKDASIRGLPVPPRDNRFYKQQLTFGNVLQGVLLCKFSGMMCENVVSDQPVLQISRATSGVVVTKESGALTKRAVHPSCLTPLPEKPPLRVAAHRLADVDCSRDLPIPFATTRRDVPARLVHGMLYNGEQDKLHIKLYENSEAVDLFIVFETKWTFTGIARPIRFNISEELWAPYRHQIRHVVIEFNHTKAQSERWYGEAVTRHRIHRYFVDEVLSDGDLLFMSDVDETIRGSFLRAVKMCNIPPDCNGGVRMDLRMFYYDLGRFTGIWPTAVKVHNSSVHKPSSLRITPPRQTSLAARAETIVLHANRNGHAGLGNRLMRFNTTCQVSNAGWHMSWAFRTLDEFLDKLTSFSHTELNTPKYNNRTWLKQVVCEGRNLFVRSSRDNYTVFRTPAHLLNDLPQLLVDQPHLYQFLRPFRCDHSPLN